MGSINSAELPKLQAPKPAAPKIPAARPAAAPTFDPKRVGAALSSGAFPGFKPQTQAFGATSGIPPAAIGEYQPPSAGAIGPGGAKWGAGGGGPNRYDYTQLGSGLWSVGIDLKAPDVKSQVQRWYDTQPSDVRAQIQRGMGPQPGRGSIDPLVYAADWRQRDVARKITKTNGFFDSFPGQLLGAGLTMAGGALGGPLGGALAGGLTGGLATKSPLGGVLGAIGGGLGAMTPGPSLKTALTKPVTAAKQAVAGKLTPQGIGASLAGGLNGTTKR